MFLLMAVGCSPAGPEPFHERLEFSGRVRVELGDAEPASVIVCDVAFQRERQGRDRNLQVTFRKEGSAVTLSEDLQGKVKAFAQEQWRDPDATELAKFEVVHHLFVAPLGRKDRINPIPDGFERVEPGRRFRVVVEESFVFHGH